jgi:DUF1365 family protein
VVTVHVAAPVTPALVVGTVAHTRRVPVRHAFRHRHYQWLVDVDALPDLPWPARLLARFDTRDHLDRGRLGGGVRGDLERFLRHRGIEMSAQDRVLMLAHARVLGHAFDPLTVFWCLTPEGVVRAVVFEVHNTYGERHAYLLDLDEDGRTVVDKDFYVSPFNDNRGRYAVRVQLSRDTVAASVGLDRDGERVLTAGTSGTPRPATLRTLARVVAGHLFMTHRVSLLIRLHGIRLWLSRLPVQPRPTHTEEAVR